MDRNDQQAIDGLFHRLAEAERNAPPRDAEAEAFIKQRVASQPAAPYFMAQTIVVMEQALEQAQARIASLEAETEEQPKRSGGFFGSLFGDDARRSPNAMPRVPRRNPAGAQAPMQGGGGFLAGAAQTAVGVAGGVLLGSAIAGMFSGGEAEAAALEETPVDAPAEDFGDMGDFEV